MTKEYYELRNNRISVQDITNIKRGLIISIGKFKEMEKEASKKGNSTMVVLLKELCKSVDSTFEWLESNIDSYPSMELEEE